MHPADHCAAALDTRVLRSSHGVIVPWDADSEDPPDEQAAALEALLSVWDGAQVRPTVLVLLLSSDPAEHRSSPPFRADEVVAAAEHVNCKVIGPLRVGDGSVDEELAAALSTMLQRQGERATSASLRIRAARRCSQAASQCAREGVMPVVPLRTLCQWMHEEGGDGEDERSDVLAYLEDTGTVILHRDGNKECEGVAILQPSWLYEEAQCTASVLEAVHGDDNDAPDRQAEAAQPTNCGSSDDNKDAAAPASSPKPGFALGSDLTSPSLSQPGKRVTGPHGCASSLATAPLAPLSAAAAALSAPLHSLRASLTHLHTLLASAHLLDREADIIVLGHAELHQKREEAAARQHLHEQRQVAKEAYESLRNALAPYDDPEATVNEAVFDPIDSAVEKRAAALREVRAALEDARAVLEREDERLEREDDLLLSAYRELKVEAERARDAIAALGIVAQCNSEKGNAALGHGQGVMKGDGARDARQWLEDVWRRSATVLERTLRSARVLHRLVGELEPLLATLVGDGASVVMEYAEYVAASAMRDALRIEERRAAHDEIAKLRARELSRMRIDYRKCDTALQSSQQAKDVREELQRALDALKMARKRERRMRVEIEDDEDEGGATEEARAALEQQKQVVAEAQRRVRDTRSALRALVVRGAEEAGVFARLVAGARVSQQQRPAADVKWQRLVYAGVADVDGSLDDFTDFHALHASSNVSRATTRADGRVVVLKKLAKGPEDDLFFNEVAVLSRLNHPNIVALERVFSSGREWYLQFPLMECGDLRRFLGTPAATRASRAVIARDIVSGLAYLHEHRVVHRDLKPENILINGAHRARLADFAISRREDRLVTRTVVDVRGQHAGTQAYASPEQLRGARATEASDLYALGLVLHELVYGKAYSQTVEERASGSVAPEEVVGNRATGVSEWEEHARDLVVQLLQYEPSLRPSAHTAQAHPFFVCLGTVDGGGTRVSQIGDGGGEREGEGGAGAEAERAARHRFGAAVEALREVADADTSRAQRQLQRCVLTADRLAEQLLDTFTEILDAGCDISRQHFVLDIRIRERGGDNAGEGEGESGGGEAEYAFGEFWQRVTSEELGVFETRNGVMYLPVSDVNDADSGGTRARLRALGAILAYCVLEQRRVTLAAGSVFWRIVLHGTSAIVHLSCASLLDLLDDYDKVYADGLRQMLHTDADALMLETVDERGVPQPLSNVSRVQHVRHAALECLVASRQGAWEAVRAGFWSARAVAGALAAHLEGDELAVFCRVAPVRAQREAAAAAALERERQERAAEVAALRAVVREVGHGRTFTCPNGHPYVVGECGGPMEVGRCFCGAEIGGRDHHLLVDNAYAAELSGQERPAYPHGVAAPL